MNRLSSKGIHVKYTMISKQPTIIKKRANLSISPKGVDRPGRYTARAIVEQISL